MGLQLPEHTRVCTTLGTTTTAIQMQSPADRMKIFCWNVRLTRSMECSLALSCTFSTVSTFVSPWVCGGLTLRSPLVLGLENDVPVTLGQIAPPCTVGILAVDAGSSVPTSLHHISTFMRVWAVCRRILTQACRECAAVSGLLLSVKAAARARRCAAVQTV